MTKIFKKRGRPSNNKDVLNPERIIDCAKLILEQDGKIPSIRKIALELQIDPMAIYYYFKNKNTLLEALSLSLIKDIYNPVNSEDWKNELFILCKSYLSLLIKYNGLLEIFLKIKTNGPSQVFIEKFNKAVCTKPSIKSNKSQVCDLLVDYLHGFIYSMNCNQTDKYFSIEHSFDSLELIFSLLD